MSITAKHKRRKSKSETNTKSEWQSTKYLQWFQLLFKVLHLKIKILSLNGKSHFSWFFPSSWFLWVCVHLFVSHLVRFVFAEIRFVCMFMAHSHRKVFLPIFKRLSLFAPLPDLACWRTVCEETHSPKSYRYHPGLWLGKKWSCCKAIERTAFGCQAATHWTETNNNPTPSKFFPFFFYQFYFSCALASTCPKFRIFLLST